ncbi:hypothetical protein [Jiangella mangrovi]|uniref:Uncharacterized protein n=1 Tax=Jiangella mangrovi TaxID=1524084 RepID=A0A7W9LKF2_9ACTN|nr:hypothetical protein [Jiangella mangrovi]MBB5787046.1 hypothetical protein [Jiangella mangrovi]
MIPWSRRFQLIFGGGFALADDEPALYIEAVEEAPVRLANDASGSYHAFREEFAVHIRESSFPPESEAESQWMTDEWLRDVWYDAFGPEPAPGDPFPVPQEDWGHSRLTDYMLHAINQTLETSAPGAAEWLAARGLTVEDIGAAVDRSPTQSVGFRSAPEGWLDHLHDLTARGLREAQPGE